MSFWVKINPFVKLLFPKYVWYIPNREKKVYLTFDDGPTPEITTWTLEQLKSYDAKATFFCIGNNIEKYPAIFKQVMAEGHAIGNHTFNHVNGWEMDTKAYIENTMKCSMIIKKKETRSKKQEKELFRPPYGKIKPAQSRILRNMGYKIIMWDVLSCDFDRSISPEQCLENVLKNVTAGSIIVFHDSEKAEPNLRYVLPKTLAHLKVQGFVCDSIV